MKSQILGFLLLLAAVEVFLQEEWRSLDGSGNNVDNPMWGTQFSHYQPLGNWAPEFQDGINEMNPAFTDARSAMKALFNGRRPYKPDVNGLSLFAVNFAFVAFHDIGGFRPVACDETICDPAELIQIPVAKCDEVYDPHCYENGTIDFTRFPRLKGTGVDGVPRQVPYLRTAWLDLDMVYGINQDESPRDPSNAAYLMELDNPERKQGFWEGLAAAVPDFWWFITLFTREHNRLVDSMVLNNVTGDAEFLFQKARKLNIAYYQKIMSRDYFSAVTGALSQRYRAYNATLEPKVDPFFKHVIARYGHYSLNDMRVLLDGNQLPTGQIYIRDTEYFRKFAKLISSSSADNPPNADFFLLQGVRGAVNTPAYDLTLNAPKGFLNFGQFGDVLTLDRLRAFDLGFPKFNTLRAGYGLGQLTTWTDFQSGEQLQEALKNRYETVDDVDAIDGFLSEKHSTGSHLGDLGRTVLRSQINTLANSDRFWFENPGMFTDLEMDDILETNIGVMIARNFPDAGITNAVPFFVPEKQLNYQGKATLFPDNGTYTNKIDLSFSYRLSWNNKPDTQEVDFMIQVATLGWIGIGFGGNPGTMKNADIILCRVQGGLPEVRDSFATDVGIPTRDESLTNGTNDITKISGSEVGGITTIRFTRKWNTNDPYDKAFVDAPQKVIFAFHSTTDDFVYHGPTRNSQRQINFRGIINSTTVPPTGSPCDCSTTTTATTTPPRTTTTTTTTRPSTAASSTVSCLLLSVLVLLCSYFMN